MFQIGRISQANETLILATADSTPLTWCPPNQHEGGTQMNLKIATACRSLEIISLDAEHTWEAWDLEPAQRFAFISEQSNANAAHPRRDWLIRLGTSTLHIAWTGFRRLTPEEQAKEQAARLQRARSYAAMMNGRKTVE